MNCPSYSGTPPEITVLGGGPAGLAAGYYAKKFQLPFTIYEASDRIGGNCTTLRYKDFYFDSGAHRFHDQDAEITRELKALLGPDLERLSVPSQIYHHGKLVDFPLSPLNLLRNIGPDKFIKAGVEVLLARLRQTKPEENFKDYTLHTYGKTIANLFLLNYSEKLWGIDCDKLSPSIAGKRLKGLNLKTFLIEAMLGQNAKVEHLDGVFYYPKRGISRIPEKLAEFCGKEKIQVNSKITKIFHGDKKVEAIEVNREKIIRVDEVVSTLPPPILLKAMEPQPPEEVLFAANGLCFRNLILVAVFINREFINKNATVYFPDSSFPFTRVHEPRNRSQTMSPEGKTSLIVEIPCHPDDQFWTTKDEILIQLVCSALIRIGWVRQDEIIDACVHKLSHAYPILEVKLEEKIKKISHFLGEFRNLKVAGRNGQFTYSHIHNMMRFGKEVIQPYSLNYAKSNSLKLGSFL